MLSRFKQGHSFANVVAVLALFVALGGSAVAAGKIKLPNGSVKAKTIKNGAVTTPKFAKGAVAPDAAKLGGVKPGGCQTGWIKGTLVVDTTGVGAAYSARPGFNCGGGEVQIKRTAVGNYDVKFVGGAGDTGSAVVSSMNANFHMSAYSIGVGEFHVVVETGAGAATDDKRFALLAF